MRTGRSSMSETSKLNGQRTCLLKNMNSRIELMRLTVDGIKFFLLLFCRKIVHFLTDRHASLPFHWFRNRDTTGHEAAGRRTVFIGGGRITHAHDGEARRRPNKSRALGR